MQKIEKIFLPVRFDISWIQMMCFKETSVVDAVLTDTKGKLYSLWKIDIMFKLLLLWLTSKITKLLLFSVGAFRCFRQLLDLPLRSHFLIQAENEFHPLLSLFRCFILKQKRTPKSGQSKQWSELLSKLIASALASNTIKYLAPTHPFMQTQHKWNESHCMTCWHHSLRRTNLEQWDTAHQYLLVFKFHKLSSVRRMILPHLILINICQEWPV